MMRFTEGRVSIAVRVIVYLAILGALWIVNDRTMPAPITFEYQAF